MKALCTLKLYDCTSCGLPKLEELVIEYWLIPDVERYG